MMKDINYVKIKYEIINQMADLERVTKSLVFKAKHFSDCETIEECRDKFYNNYHGEDRIEWIEVSIYKTKEDLDKDNFYEYIGE